MIYDCFMFHDELDVLEIRLGELSPYVDHFIIVEGNKTHSGIAKGSIFLEHQSRYADWQEKITHVIADLPDPFNGNRWVPENAQRNAILTGLGDPKISLRPEDWIFISDADELWNFKTWNGQEGVFSCINCYFKLNMMDMTRWNGTCAIQAWRFGSPYGAMLPQDARNFRDIFRQVGLGWHFGWLGDPKKKVKAFAHAEFDVPEIELSGKNHPVSGKPLLRIPIDDRFPQYVIDHQDKFAHLIEA